MRRGSSKLRAQQLNNFFNNPKEEEPQSVPDSLTVKSVGSYNQESAQKLCMRIWSGYTKFLRSQCNKNRVIDSLYFGSFLKKEV